MLTIIKVHIYKSFVSFTLVETCNCNAFVDEEGYGACNKRDPQLGRLFSCYVNKTSGCKDIVATKANEDLTISAIACEDENEGKVRLKWHQYITCSLNINSIRNINLYM